MRTPNPDNRTSIKRPTNISLDGSLLAEAKALGINLSRAAEQGIAEAVRQKRGEVWLAENGAALDSSNAHVEAHGLPLTHLRQF